MRSTIVVVLVVLAARVAVAGPAAPPQWSHTRPLTPSAARLVADATVYTPAVRALLEALERTDVVVYVTDSMSGPDGLPQAYLRFVARAAGLRYLAVYVDRLHVSPTDRMAWLGHELQHALEVAAAPDVQDVAGLRRHYQRIGWESGSNRFETAAARAMTGLVRNELTGFGK